MSSSGFATTLVLSTLVVSGLAKKASCPVVRCPAPPTDCAYTTSTATGATGCLLHPCGVLNCDALNAMHVDADAPCANGECMETESNMVQLGAMPYLYGGGGNNHQDSELACKEQCLAHPTCKYGTFVTRDAALSDNSHAFRHHAERGECWLSETTHERPTTCGVPCTGFKRVAAADAKPATRTAGHLHKDAARCRMRSYGPKQSHHPCDPENPDPLIFMQCMSSCAHQGFFNYKRSTCTCDPSDLSQQSKFTTCHKDPFGQHIKVMHIEPRFHTREYRGGEQHRCLMIKEDPQCIERHNHEEDPERHIGPDDHFENTNLHCARKCHCCDCRDHGSFYDIVDIGFGIHTAAEPFLTDDPPIVDDAQKCMHLCHKNPECRAGTYMSDSDHKGQCWLSNNIEAGKRCENTCESFVKVNKESEQVCDMDAIKVERRKASGMTCRARPVAPPCDCPAEYDPVSCAGGKSYASLCLAHCELATECEMVNEDPLRPERTCNRVHCKATENLVGADKERCGGYCEEKPDYNVCCKAVTVGCLACQAGKSTQDYCRAHPDAPVCQDYKPCCQEMNIACLACQAGLSSDQYYCLAHPRAPKCL